MADDESAKLAQWERYVPVRYNSEDWQTYNSFPVKQSDTVGRRTRYLSLAQLVRQTVANGVPGKFIECGCFIGYSAHVIARTMQRLGVTDRRLMVFDSFEGLSPASPEDLNVPPDHVDSLNQQAGLRSGRKMFASPMAYTQQNLQAYDFIDFYKGWIPDSFAGHEDQRFAFAHVDVDLYAPVKAALEFIYERMPKGGIIQIDDYNFVDWPGANQAVDEFRAAAKPSFFYEIPLGGAFLIK